MLHACAERFDVTGNLENFLIFRVNASDSADAIEWVLLGDLGAYDGSTTTCSTPFHLLLLTEKKAPRKKGQILRHGGDGFDTVTEWEKTIMYGTV